MFAKAMGNYEILEGGTQTEAQAFLSGAPSASFQQSSTGYTGATAWTAIQTAASLKYIVAAYTASGAGGDSAANAWGIPFGHAYTVLGVYTLTDATGKALDQVFKMRNPWGSDSFNSNAATTYSGKWNDGDATSWATVSAASKTAVGYANNLKDGVFFVSQAIWSQMFVTYEISYFRDAWVHSTSSVIADNGLWQHFTFTLSAVTNAYIGVHYYAPRMYPKTAANSCRASTAYTSGKFAVFSPALSATQMGTSTNSVYDFSHFGYQYSASWPAGSYDVWVQTKWPVSDAKDFTFRIYSPSLVTITKAVQPTTAAAAVVQIA